MKWRGSEERKLEISEGEEEWSSGCSMYVEWVEENEL